MKDPYDPSSQRAWREWASENVRRAVLEVARIWRTVSFDLQVMPSEEPFLAKLEGLLCVHDKVCNEYDLHAAPTYHSPDFLTIGIRFAQNFEFPTEVRKIYNLWRCCHEGVELVLLPEFGPTLLVDGVRIALPLAPLNGDLLLHGIREVSRSRSLALEFLQNGNGKDWWEIDGPS